MRARNSNKGILVYEKDGWVVNHSLIDPYSQITHPLPLHPESVLQLKSNRSKYNMVGDSVTFELVADENYKYYAKLIEQKFNQCPRSCAPVLCDCEDDGDLECGIFKKSPSRIDKTLSQFQRYDISQLQRYEIVINRIKDEVLFFTKNFKNI